MFTKQTQGFADALGSNGNTRFECVMQDNGDMVLEFGARVDTDSCTRIVLKGVSATQIGVMIGILRSAQEYLKEVENA